MKYIKLFEAFDSNKLNKIIAWKKVSANDKNRMLDLVKNIAKINDLPESKLSDDLFEYLPFNKALAYNNSNVSNEPCDNTGDDGEVCDNGKVKKTWGTRFRNVECLECKGTGIKSNKSELSLIKFWFDVNGKFITTTAVDGVYRPSLDGVTAASFSDKVTDYDIVRRIPKTQISTLKTGDMVVCDLVTPTTQRDRTWGREGTTYPAVVSYIWVETSTYYGTKIYALQNTRDGGNHSPRDYQTVKSIASKSWLLSSSRTNNISILKPKENVTGNDPYGWNTTFDTRNLKIIPVAVNSLIKNANFAIILDLNKLSRKEYIKKTVIKKDRSDSREGAIALVSDQDIKNENLKRYMKKMFELSSIKGDLDDIMRFKKIVNKGLGGKHLIYYLNGYSDSSFLNNLTKIAGFLFKIVKRIKTAEIDGNVESLKDNTDFSIIVSAVNNRYREILDNVSNSNNAIDKILITLKKDINAHSADYDKEDTKNELKILELIEKLSIDINKYFESFELNTLEDIEILIQEIGLVKELISSERLNIYKLNNFFNIMRPYYGYSNPYRTFKNQAGYYEDIINGLTMLSTIIKKKHSLNK